MVNDEVSRDLSRGHLVGNFLKRDIDYYIIALHLEWLLCMGLEKSTL